MYFRWTDKEEQVFQRDYSKDKNFRMYLIGISWDSYYLIVEELDRPMWIRWITKLRQKIKKEKDARRGKVRIMRKNLKGSDKNDSSSIFFHLSGEQEDYSSVFAIYRVSFHSLKRNIYRITRQNSRSIVFAFWLPNFYSQLFYSINNTLQQYLKQLQLFGIIFKNPSFEERQASQRLSFLGLFQQPHQV